MEIVPTSLFAKSMQGVADELLGSFGGGVKATLRRYSRTSGARAAMDGKPTRILADELSVLCVISHEMHEQTEHGSQMAGRTVVLSGKEVGEGTTVPLDGEWKIVLPGSTEELDIVGAPRAITPDGQTVVIWTAQIQEGSSL